MCEYSSYLNKFFPVCTFIRSRFVRAESSEPDSAGGLALGSSGVLCVDREHIIGARAAGARCVRQRRRAARHSRRVPACRIPHPTRPPRRKARPHVRLPSGRYALTWLHIETDTPLLIVAIFTRDGRLTRYSNIVFVTFVNCEFLNSTYTVFHRMLTALCSFFNIHPSLLITIITCTSMSIFSLYLLMI